MCISRIIYNCPVPPQYPARRANLAVERVGRDLLVYTTGDPAHGGAVHTLNSTAALIWDLCDGTHSPSDIEAAVRRSFQVPPDRDLASDIAAILSSLSEKGLLAD
jgi:hypothetical protein